MSSISGLGRLFRGRGAGSNGDEETARFSISLKEIEASETVLGEGQILEGTDEERCRNRVIKIPDKDRRGHLWCFGTTRIGKTRIIEHMVEQDIRKGYSVILLDPKTDKVLFEKIVQTALEERRHDELILVTPTYPEYSAEFNPLSHHFMIEELVGHLVSGVTVGREPYFFNVANQMSTVVVEALDLLARYEGVPTKIRMQDAREYIEYAMLEELKNQVESMDSEKLKEEAARVSRSIGRILSNEPDYFNKVSNSLDVALQELTSGSIGRIVGRSRENRLISRLESGRRVIFVVQQASELTRRAAYTLGKVVMSVIQAFIGRIYASGRERVDPPICVYVDEAQSVLYDGIDELFAKGGGADVWVHGFCQSLEKLYGAVDRHVAKAILSNTNTKLFMRAPDAETAEHMSGYFGEKKLLSPVLSTDGSMTMREIEEPILKPSELLRAGEREFFLYTYSGSFRGKSTEVTPCYLTVEYPKILVKE